MAGLMFCPHSAAGPVKGMMHPTLSVFCSTGDCGVGVQASIKMRHKQTGIIDMKAKRFRAI